MPDGDIFARALAPCWRVPARLANARADDATVGRATLKSLWRTLHEAGGCPKLRELLDVVAGYHSSLGDGSPDPTAYERACGSISALVAAADGHKHTRLAAEEARVALGSARGDGADTRLLAIPGELFAERVCSRLIDHYLLDVQRPLLVGARFASRDDARSWEGDLGAAMGTRVSAIARDLWRDPSGQTVRNPRWRRAATTTEDLLKSSVAVAVG